MKKTIIFTIAGLFICTSLTGCADSSEKEVEEVNFNSFCEDAMGEGWSSNHYSPDEKKPTTTANCADCRKKKGETPYWFCQNDETIKETGETNLQILIEEGLAKPIIQENLENWFETKNKLVAYGVNPADMGFIPSDQDLICKKKHGIFTECGDIENFIGELQ